MSSPATKRPTHLQSDTQILLNLFFQQSAPGPPTLPCASQFLTPIGREIALQGDNINKNVDAIRRLCPKGHASLLTRGTYFLGKIDECTEQIRYHLTMAAQSSPFDPDRPPCPAIDRISFAQLTIKTVAYLQTWLLDAKSQALPYLLTLNHVILKAKLIQDSRGLSIHPHPSELIARILILERAAVLLCTIATHSLAQGHLRCFTPRYQTTFAPVVLPPTKLSSLSSYSTVKLEDLIQSRNTRDTTQRLITQALCASTTADIPSKISVDIQPSAVRAKPSTAAPPARLRPAQSQSSKDSLSTPSTPVQPRSQSRSVTP